MVAWYECSDCGNKKRGVDFYHRSDGRRSGRCQECHRELGRKNRLANGDKWSKKRQQDRIAEVNAIKAAAGCKVCGENNPVCLDFHHLDPAEKSFTVSQRNIMGQWPKVVEEMAKCVVLCSNCHRKFHAGQIEL